MSPSSSSSSENVSNNDNNDTNTTNPLMWTEKYRPNSLSELISGSYNDNNNNNTSSAASGESSSSSSSPNNTAANTSAISTSIHNFIKNPALMPHLLFYGPAGTGKTSTILAVAKQIYGKDPKQLKKYVLELNASDARGIDVIRDKIKSFASTRQLFGRVNAPKLKLVILDEADQMTREAQAALRRTIEQYAESTRFCIICNYIHKITDAIQSRCTKFRFAPLDPRLMVRRLQEICNLEGIRFDHASMEAVVQISRGDMRKALMILQSTVSARGPHLTEQAVYESTGSPLPLHIQHMVHSLLQDDFEVSFQRIRKLQVEGGYALQDLVRETFLFTTRLRLPSDMLAYLIDELSNIEERLTYGASEKLQLSALIGLYHLAREAIGCDVSIDEILDSDIALSGVLGNDDERFVGEWR